MYTNPLRDDLALKVARYRATLHKRDLTSYELQSVQEPQAFEWQGPPMPVSIDSDYTMSVAPAPAWWEVRQPVPAWKWKRLEGVKKHHKLRLRVEHDVLVELGTGGASASARCVMRLKEKPRLAGLVAREAVAEARLGYAAFTGFVNGEFKDGKGRVTGIDDGRCPARAQDRVLQSGQVLATDVEEFRFLSRMVLKAG